MITKADYNKIKRDVKYIEQQYGEVYDFCGDWCDCRHLRSLIDKPNYETAYKVLKSKLEHYFISGYDGNIGCHKKLPINEDEMLQDIKDRYNLYT